MDEQLKVKRRMSYGKCLLCDATVSKGKMSRHIETCLQEHEALGKADDKQKAGKARIFHLVAQGGGQPEYGCIWKPAPTRRWQSWTGSCATSG